MIDRQSRTDYRMLPDHILGIHHYAAVGMVVEAEGVDETDWLLQQLDYLRERFGAVPCTSAVDPAADPSVLL